MKIAVTSVLWSLAMSCSAVAQDSFHGACDASAAVALGRSYFVVADDEGDILRVYRRGSEMPVTSVDLSDYLGNRKANGKNAEADIEGAAAIGTRIYWITSHALKGGEGAADPHRRRFFATDIVAGDAVLTVKTVTAAPYALLLEALLADPRFEMLTDAAQRPLEQEGGLNIEGLAAAPDGGLLIGFRNPIPQGRALLVPLRNPRAIIDDGAAPVFGDPIQLDLGGRGIRSLEQVGDEVLVAAGPYGTAVTSSVLPAFALFRWSGKATEGAAFVSALDAGTFRPEALFFDTQTQELVLLSDDGDEQVGDSACKEKSVPVSSKAFRARAMAAPALAVATACVVDKTASYAGETLVLARQQGLLATANLGLFKAPLAVNTDGAPTSYHPDDYRGERLALNHIDNGIAIKASDGTAMTLQQRMAVFDRWRQSPDWQVPAGSRITWQNVIASEAGKPCIFKQNNPGYFGSLTALKNGLSAAAAGECGVNNQIDQRFVPAVVLRGAKNPLRDWGVKVGDLVLAANPATHLAVPAIVGDSGDEQRIGEGSVALNLALLPGAQMPTTYRQALSLDTGTQEMVIAVLPKSILFQRVLPYSRENIAQRVTAWAAAQGYSSLQAMTAVALDCTRGL